MWDQVDVEKGIDTIVPWKPSKDTPRGEARKGTAGSITTVRLFNLHNIEIDQHLLQLAQSVPVTNQFKGASLFEVGFSNLLQRDTVYIYSPKAENTVHRSSTAALPLQITQI